MKIANVEFVFTNRDRVNITAGWIPHIKVYGVQKNIMQVAGAGITVCYTCRDLDIMLEEDAPGTAVDEYGNTLTQTATERVLMGGLSRVIFTTTDGEKYKLAVPDRRFNWTQRIKKNRKGGITIHATDSERVF